MLSKIRKSSGGSGTRKVSPPGPVCMTEDQMASYLTDLRTSRLSRPLGSRPLPTKNATFPSLMNDLPPQVSSTLTMPRPPDPAPALVTTSVEGTNRSTSSLSHRRAISAVPPVGQPLTNAGRPLVKEPPPGVEARDFSPTSPMGPVKSSEVPYRESGPRWTEWNEAHSMRLALAELDLKEERRLHSAAQDEAADLVWRHQNLQEAGTPYKNPDHRSRVAQLEKGNHLRSQSLGRYAGLDRSLDQGTGAGLRSASDSSSGSSPGLDGAEETGKVCGPKKPSVKFAIPAQSYKRRRSSGQKSRNVSGESSKSLFRNPEDQIYEEPEELEKHAVTISKNTSASIPLTVKPRNSLPRGARDFPDRFTIIPAADAKKLSRFEIHRNAPSQSRNPLYTSNERAPTTPPDPEVNKVSTKDGIEIRGDDIRAATSMRLKDRSAKLPQPTIVSDRPGRPIVSFDPSWKAREAESKQGDTSSHIASTRSLSKPSLPHSTASAPVIPTISLPGDSASLPLIHIGDERSHEVNDFTATNSAPAVPTLNFPNTGASSVPSNSMGCPISISSFDDPPFSAITASRDNPTPLATARALPTPTKARPKPTARAQTNQPTASPSMYSYRRGPTATCTSCSLPIAGRIVTACSHRFHAECFSCHHCSEPLECVAFYPEPDNKRAERIQDGGQDADEGMRFFCHLDFHEFFSPRCRSCKTPIEGEVVVAAGAEWHVGHFFCAECGDPFDQHTPFVERDGYAWCVGCHTKRTAARCRGCKKLIMDEVTITALGVQWHGGCFVCVECGGGFGDEGRFFVRSGADGKEVGVCEGCEERRLKA